jgi:serine phosphatase RsbU (regulator of sigma subunit)
VPLIAVLLCILTGAAAAEERVFFWDTPERFTAERSGFPQTASCEAFALIAWQEAQTHGDSIGIGDFGEIYISIAINESGSKDWSFHRRVAGPFAYAGTEPSIFSVTVDKSGKIFLCVAASISEVRIYTSENKGHSWSETSLGTRGADLSHAERTRSNSSRAVYDALVPKLFQMANGTYELFIVRNAGQSITLYFARSKNGVQWSSFQPFVTEPGMPLCFLPFHIVFDGNDIIVFQSFISTQNYSTYQLFIKYSSDSGASWSRAKRISDFQDPFINTTASPDAFNNERVHLSAANEEIFMVWERRYGSSQAAIYGITMNKQGDLLSSPERLNSEFTSCNNPIGFSQGNIRYCIWFDNRYGPETIIAAVKTGIVWDNFSMSKNSERAIFARPVEIGGVSYIFWQELDEDYDLAKSRIVIMGPDNKTFAPAVTAINFTSGVRIASDVARISWTIPEDTSGIEGFSWSWSQDSSVEPEKIKNSFADKTSIDIDVTKDGPWYFKIRAQDFAGNWSEPSGIVFVRDKTPPPPVEFVAPRVDSKGFLLSNTFTLRWNPSVSPDLAGYAWQLDGETQSEQKALRVMNLEPSASYENHDDGVWRFTVFAIDDLGNVSDGRSILIRLNKYIPHTFITWVDFIQDFMGDVDLALTGRGFTESGNIKRVSLVPAGSEGIERVFEEGSFNISGDRHISLKRVENLKAGVYYITVEHPVRGLARSPSTITVGPSFTYKFGDFTKYWEASWIVRFSRGFVFDIWTVLPVLALLLFGLLFIRTLQGAALVFNDAKMLRLEAAALLHGLDMPGTKKQIVTALRRRGLSLRLKLALFTVALVLLVIGMVSTPLYLTMLRNQRQTLMQSLWDRSQVLLESLAFGARSFLPANNVLELGFLPAQSVAVNEAQFVTITGFGTQKSTGTDFVWASNDKNIEKKITTQKLQPGISRIYDGYNEKIQELEAGLNAEARIKIGSLSDSLAGLYREGAQLALQTDEDSIRRLERIDEATREMNARVSMELTELSAHVYSVPDFNIEKADGNLNYMLLKPIMFRQAGSDIYVRGWVRLEISSVSIEQAIRSAERRTLNIILFIALGAIALGAALSFILATFIVLPLYGLVRHVALIRDTEDKRLLAGHEINSKSSDEIGVLGDTINEMTAQLVKAAIASQDLSIGKEIQKKFIPLETDESGNKLTSGFQDTKYAEFFGYYEGAKGVSGDYFDYRDLDGRYWAIIKCDVAGKGIPAALIMVQVATMFINFFRDWHPGEEKMMIDNLVYEINSFIEELGFEGRFAAFTLCLFDSETGVARFCNAGDNLLHIYDASERKIKIITLPQTPAVGVMPNSIIKTKGSYAIQNVTLDHGDILLLYTDGIEEAKRIFRDSSYNEIECNYKNAPRDTIHENHLVGQNNEEFGAERVNKIINAVMSRQSYELYKHHNPHGEVTYHFDFSSCSNSVQDLIMALVSIEKVFRICKQRFNNKASGRVLVDKKIDEFLRKHFLEYAYYLGESVEYSEDPAYKYYLNMNEDEQYDDLTILGMKRK